MLPIAQNGGITAAHQRGTANNMSYTMKPIGVYSNGPKTDPILCKHNKY